jgi:hypothetical protein
MTPKQQLAQVDANPIPRRQYRAAERARRNGAIDQRFAPPSKGLRFNYPYWRNLPSWSLHEAVALTSRKPGVAALMCLTRRPFEETMELHFRHDPARVLDGFERAIVVGDITDPARPAEWIALAQRLGVAIPRELQPAAQAAPKPPPSGIRTNMNANAEDTCVDWIKALTQRPQNLDVALTEARQVFGSSLSKKAFCRAWAIGAPEEWKRGGRRKSAPR